MKNQFIPEQIVGSKLDLSANIKLDDKQEALDFFEIVKKRLLNVNKWDEICNAPSSTFKLINFKNQPITGLVKKNDYIRIKIPGPGTKLGEGFDWVRVESINEKIAKDEEILSITVRPCSHPLKPKNEIAHFFQPTATSTFQVYRNGNLIYATVHGRNEIPNTKNGRLLDKIRNTLIAWSAKLGFSYPRWKLLVNGLLNK